MAKDVRALGDFERQIKKLRKNRHNLTSDYKDFVVNLEASHQQWDRVKDVGDAPLWTSRMQDSSSNRGKSGGFRVYFFVTDEVIWLVHIQLRKDGNTVPGWTLLRALKHARLWSPQ
ncbi:MAG: hypothetical protein OXN88_02615 [Chloroflexota bacterium]|nr:hypothetical protein [Chloroflexota bacterium]